MNAHHLEKLRELRAQIEEELLGLKAKEAALVARAAGVDEAIEIVSAPDSGQPGDGAVRTRQPRGTVKDTALRLLQEHAEHGLTAVELVEVASGQGIPLDRGSISSLLSKLKSAGTLDLDTPTSKYRPAARLNGSGRLPPGAHLHGLGGLPDTLRGGKAA